MRRLREPNHSANSKNPVKRENFELATQSGFVVHSDASGRMIWPRDLLQLFTFREPTLLVIKVPLHFRIRSGLVTAHSTPRALLTTANC